MRPSIRPVAAATRYRSLWLTVPFVCSRCQSATQHQHPNSSLPIRYNSSATEPSPKDKIPFSEKVRRRIWGTDQPPGQKDPYSRASPEEMKRLWEDEERLVEEETRHKEEKARIRESTQMGRKARGGWLGRLKQTESLEVAGSRPNVPLQDGADIAKAPTNGELEAFDYVPATSTDGLTWVGGQAMRDLMVQKHRRENPFHPFIPEAKSDPANARALVATALEQALGSPILASQRENVTEYWENYDITVNPELKFMLLRIVTNWTGQRVPDPVISGLRTAGDLAKWLESFEQPAQLSAQLRAMPELQALPNVEIHSRRIDRNDRDREFGYAKVITAEQRRRGL